MEGEGITRWVVLILVVVIIGGWIVLTGLQGGGDNGREVFREQYGDERPLTVEKGIVHCVKGPYGTVEALFQHDGIYYSLSFGVPGRWFDTGAHSIQSIRRFDPDSSSSLYPYYPLDVLAEAALDQCQAAVGDYALVAARESGLRVIDISDPSSPGQVGTFNTQDYAGGVAVTGSIIDATDYEWRSNLPTGPFPCSPCSGGTARSLAMCSPAAWAGLLTRMS